jgi:hypothetical protein
MAGIFYARRRFAGPSGDPRKPAPRCPSGAQAGNFFSSYFVSFVELKIK